METKMNFIINLLVWFLNEARNQIHPLNINKSVDNDSSWAVPDLQ